MGGRLMPKSLAGSSRNTQLGCVISEEWDYTYIIWHKNNGAVEALAPYIKASRLEHFHD
jgi:hypothetical protein